MKPRAFAAAVVLGAAVAALAAPWAARADDPPKTGPQAAPSPGAGAKEAPKPTCTEVLPKGASRPIVTEFFPPRGMSGYAANLEVNITHGKGETVLPEGLNVSKKGEGAQAVADAGFAIADPDGGAPTRIQVTTSPNDAITKLVLPFVPLPKHAGRHDMLLPSIAIAVARANGEYMTICTKVHPIRVEDPIANELTPKVRPNPPGRPQREEWVFLKQLAIGLAIGAVAALLAAWGVRRWMGRVRIVPPKPKPHPWLVALEELERIRRSNLLENHQNDVYFDRVSDCIRSYLGARYNFEALEHGWSGLEATTDEMKALLKRVRPPIVHILTISDFLDEADLVKFARVFPTDGECSEALRRAEQIVRRTIPPTHATVPGTPPAEARPEAGATP
jgi:hypothetical protein